MGRHDRPENSAPPEIFYNEDEARKYTENSRMVTIQTTLTERALELLALPDDGEPKLLLDLGCGSGLSGEALTERGHVWVVSTSAAAPPARPPAASERPTEPRSTVCCAGMAASRCLCRSAGEACCAGDVLLPPPTSAQGLDISKAMLDVAAEREVEGDLCLHDLGHGLPIRPGTADGAISISAVQWLCNAVSAAPPLHTPSPLPACCQPSPAGSHGRRPPERWPCRRKEHGRSHHLPPSPPCPHLPASSPAAPPPQDTSANEPRKRLRRFFDSLYACLAKGARAVLQIYPANTEQAAMMTNAAMRAGFSGGLVVDFPHRWGQGWGLGWGWGCGWDWGWVCVMFGLPACLPALPRRRGAPLAIAGRPQPTHPPHALPHARPVSHAAPPPAAPAPRSTFWC